LIIIEYIYISDIDSLTVSFISDCIARKPNIELDIQDQTNIALNLFNTILDIANTWVELNRSWATVEQDISAQERWEARQRQLRNQP
jgi:enamine deaminase RidA (YjgF/YER057c/UK114 family)